jgi:hypothetical protein
MTRVGTDSGEQVLDTAVAAAREVFGPELEAVYALGSLAHGGFAPLVSDVDMALVLTSLDGATAGRIERVRELTGRRCPSPLTQRLSLFWADAEGVRHGCGAHGRLSEVDRLDLIDAGRLLAGTDRRAGAVRPDSAGMIRVSAELAVSRFDERYLRGLTDPVELVAGGVRPVTKATLFPVRFLFTLRTGQIGHNASAGTWYTARGAHRALVERALRWREEGIADPDEAVALLEQELLGVYDEFFGAYVQDLPAAGVDAPKLVDDLEARWKVLQDLGSS